MQSLYNSKGLIWIKDVITYETINSVMAELAISFCNKEVKTITIVLSSANMTAGSAKQYVGFISIIHELKKHAKKKLNVVFIGAAMTFINCIAFIADEIFIENSAVVDFFDGVERNAISDDSIMLDDVLHRIVGLDKFNSDMKKPDMNSDDLANLLQSFGKHVEIAKLINLPPLKQLELCASTYFAADNVIMSVGVLDRIACEQLELQIEETVKEHKKILICFYSLGGQISFVLNLVRRLIYYKKAKMIEILGGLIIGHASSASAIMFQMFDLRMSLGMAYSLFHNACVNGVEVGIEESIELKSLISLVSDYKSVEIGEKIKKLCNGEHILFTDELLANGLLDCVVNDLDEANKIVTDSRFVEISG